MVKRYELKLAKPLAKLELEELRAALLRVRECLRAADAYDAWFEASGMALRDARLAATQATTLRSRAMLRKALSEYGDPSDPHWRPGWRVRARSRVAAFQSTSRSWGR